MPGHRGGEGEEDCAGDVGRAAHDFAEAAEFSLGVLHAPGGEGAGEDHGQRQPEAERGHEGKAEGDFFELEADEQDREGRRAGQEAAGQAEEHDLGCGDGAAGETLRDLLGVRAFVVIFKAGARIVVVMRVVMIMLMGLRGMQVAARAEKHPGGQPEDQRGGGELEIGFGLFCVPLVAVVQGQAGEQPNDERM